MADYDMSIHRFLAQFKKGFARQNRYRVEFHLPKGIPAGTAGANTDATNGTIQQLDNYFNGSQGINIKCHTATFPQRSLLTSGITQNSAEFRVPYSVTYDPVSFSFYADSEMDTRDYFEVWQSAVANYSNNTMNFFEEYVADVKLFQLDATGKDTYGVTLFQAWPLNIAAIDVSYSSMDTTQSTMVTMAFKSWLPWNNNGGVNRSGSSGAR